MYTNLPAADVSAAEATALSLLFTRFVSGEIPDASWAQMMSILDEDITSLEERSGLVNFLSDACSDLGPDAVEVPPVGDVEDLVMMMRAA